MGNPQINAPSAEKPVAWLWIQMILDSAAWIVAMCVAVLLRYEMNVQFVSVGGLVITCAVAVACQMVVGFSFALYKGRYSFGSFEEAKLLVVVTVIVTAILEVVLLMEEKCRLHADLMLQRVICIVVAVRPRELDDPDRRAHRCTFPSWETPAVVSPTGHR